MPVNMNININTTMIISMVYTIINKHIKEWRKLTWFSRKFSLGSRTLLVQWWSPNKAVFIRRYAWIRRSKSPATTKTRTMAVTTFFFSRSMYYPRTTLALPPIVTQIRGHIVGPPPPSPLRYVPSFLSREDFSIFCPRRLASNCNYPRC